MYDVIIIGAGSAGMAAGIYTARFGLETVIIGKVVGGLLNDSHRVENYPGFTAIPGFDLMMKFKEHVDSLKVPVKEEWVTSINKNKDGTFTATTDKAEYTGKTVILTMGTKHRHLGLPHEEEFAGKGISYCATCDGAFFKDQDVAVVGGGDSAALGAQLLAQHAKSVTVLVRKEKMRAEPINLKRLEENDTITIKYNTEVKELLGKDGLEGVKLSDGSELKVTGLFVEIGHIIQSELAEQLGVKLNEHKEIIIDSGSKTNVPGIYAAGDVANRRFKQAITGAAEGVIAAFSAYEFIKQKQDSEKVDVGWH